jgi:hypothetical protein
MNEKNKEAKETQGLEWKRRGCEVEATPWTTASKMVLGEKVLYRASRQESLQLFSVQGPLQSPQITIPSGQFESSMRRIPSTSSSIEPYTEKKLNP